MENLRHLDTAIVLSLVKARSDYSPTIAMTLSGATTWTKQLEDIHCVFRGDIALPWENRKHNSIMTFTESNTAGPSTLGPTTLRKSPTLGTAPSNKSTRDGPLQGFQSGFSSPFISFPFGK